MKKAIALFFIVILLCSCSLKRDSVEMKIPPASSRTPEIRASVTIPASSTSLPPEPMKTEDSGMHLSPTPEFSAIAATQDATASPVLMICDTVQSTNNVFIKACYDGDVTIIKSLISREPGLINAKNKNGWTPLHTAAAQNLETVRVLIENGADVNARTKNGMIPLSWAARKGKREIVQFLIANGSDINAREEDGLTPLHGAARWGYNEIVEDLIDKGADISIKDNDGQSALKLAIDNGRRDTADLLRKHGAKE